MNGSAASSPASSSSPLRQGKQNMKAFVFVAAMAIAGCGDSGSRKSPNRDRLGANEQALRVKVDTARNRLWVLGPDDLYVYDMAKRHLILRIALPGWSVTDFICPPDIALDRAGTAFISDNAQPRLWRIDADSFHLTEHAVRLLNKEHWDIGFGGLAFAADGTLFGVTASGGSLWSIDLLNARAHQVELGASMDACPLSVIPLLPR